MMQKTVRVVGCLVALSLVVVMSLNAFAQDPSFKVTIDKHPDQADPTNTLPIVFTLNFYRTVVGFEPSDVVFDGTAEVLSYQASESTIVVLEVGGNGTVEPRIPAGAVTDTRGNANPESNLSDPEADASVLYDTTLPEVSIVTPTLSRTTSVPVTFPVNYTDAAEITLSSSDIVLNITGDASASVRVDGSGNTTRYVTLYDILGEGSISISIAAGTASDAAGNLAAATTPSESVEVSPSETREVDLANHDENAIFYGALDANELTMGRGVCLADLNGDGLDDVILAAWAADAPTREHAGQIYVYYGSQNMESTFDIAGTAGTAPDVVVTGADSFDFNDYLTDSGNLVAADLNGDNRDDLIIGAPLADGPDGARIEAGAVYVLYGGDLSGNVDLATSADVTIYGAQTGDRLSGGEPILTPDINTDGTADLVVAAPLADGPAGSRPDAGVVYVIPGGDLPASIDLSQSSIATTVHGVASGDQLGGDALTSGDVNGDDVDDVIVGSFAASNKSGTLFETGAVYIILGQEILPGTVDLATSDTPRITGPVAGGRMTLHGGLATADLNGDGFEDIILGSYAPPVPNGTIHIIYGSEVHAELVELSSVAADVTVNGADDNDWLGISGAIATGDINGDQYDDLVLGASMAAGPDNQRFLGGEAYIILGSSNLPATMSTAGGSIATVIQGSTTLDLMRSFGGKLQDLNGDGLDDVLLFASRADGPNESRPDAGEIYLIPGARALPRLVDLSLHEEAVIVYGATRNDQLAGSVNVGMGDVNGDGVGDVLIGAHLADGPSEVRRDAGEAYLIFGEPVGPPILFVDTRAETLGGCSEVETSFALSNQGAGIMQWQATADCDWILDISPASGSINGGETVSVSVTISPNDSGALRQCSIVASSSNAANSEMLVDVTQAPADAPLLEVSPEEKKVGATAGETTVSVSNGACGNLEWSTIASCEWVSFPQSEYASLAGGESAELVLEYMANTGRSERTCTIYVFTPDAPPEEVVLVQEGMEAPLLTAKIEDDGVCGCGEGVLEVTLRNEGGSSLDWNGAADCGWITLITPNSGTLDAGEFSTLTLSYSANTSAQLRQCTLSFTPSEGEAVSLDLVQGGFAEAALVIEDVSSVLAGCSDGQVEIPLKNVGCGTLEWQASADAAWISSITPAGGTLATGEDTVLIVNYEANPLFTPREAEIAFLADSGPNATIVLKQSSIDKPILEVSSEELEIGGCYSGVVALNVINTGCSSLGWEALDLPDWLSASPNFGELEGGESTPINLVYDVNATSAERFGTVRIVSGEAANNQVTVDIIQSAAATPLLECNVTALEVGACSGEVAEASVVLINSGCEALEWEAFADAEWILDTLPTQGTLLGGEQTEVTILFGANSGQARSTSIEFTSTQSGADVVSVELTQAGYNAPFLELEVDEFYVGGCIGNNSQLEVMLKNTGCAPLTWATTWSETWASATPDTGSLDAGASQVITIDFAVNPMDTVRDLNALFVSPEAANGAVQAVLTQLTAELPMLAASEDTVVVGGCSTETARATVSLSNTGCSNLTWLAISDLSWISSISPAEGLLAAGESQDVEITFDINSSSDERHGALYFTSVEAGNSIVQVNILQADAQTPVVEVVPSLDFIGGCGGSGGQTEVVVTNTGCGTMPWYGSWPEGDPTVLSMTPDEGELGAGESVTVVVTYSSNPDPDPRSSLLTFYAPLAANHREDVTLRQIGWDTSCLEVRDEDAIASVEEGTASVYLSNANCDGPAAWSVSWEADWITGIEPATGSLAPGEEVVLTVTHTANAATDARGAVLTFTTYDSDGVTPCGTALLATVTQLGVQSCTNLNEDFCSESIDEFAWSVGGATFGEASSNAGAYTYEHTQEDCTLIASLAGPGPIETPDDVDDRFEAWGRTSSGKNWEFRLGGNASNKAQWDWAENAFVDNDGLTVSSVDWTLNYDASEESVSWVWANGDTVSETLYLDVASGFGQLRIEAQSRPSEPVTPRHAVLVSDLLLIANGETVIGENVVSDDGEIAAYLFRSLSLTGDWTLTGTTTMAYEGREPTGNQQWFSVTAGGDPSSQTGEVGGAAWVQTTQDFNDGQNHLINFTWSTQTNADHLDYYAIQMDNSMAPNSSSYTWVPNYSGNLYFVSEPGYTAEMAWSIYVNAVQRTATLYAAPDRAGDAIGEIELSGDTAWYLRFLHLDAANGGDPATDNALLLHSFSTESPSCCRVEVVAGFEASVVAGDGPLTVAFTDLSTGLPTAWAWDFDGDGITDSTEQDPVYTYQVTSSCPTTYDVTLTARNPYCTDSGSITKTAYITVTDPEAPLPAAIVRFTATPNVIEPGQSTTLSWIVLDADTIEIDKGVGTLSNAETGSITVTPESNTEWIMTATDVCGSVQRTAGVTVQTPVPGKALVFYLDLNDNGSFDAGEGQSDVEVFLNGSEIGATDEQGRIVYNDARVGDPVFGRKLLAELPAVKTLHEAVDGLLYSLYVDSDTMKTESDETLDAPDGSYRHIRLDGEAVQYVELTHPIFAWNVIAAFESGLDDEASTWWIDTFEQASKLLYDATDGHMRFGAVHLDGTAQPGTPAWGAADIVIRADELRPHTHAGAALRDAGRIAFGEIWRGQGITSGENASLLPSVIAHQFGHYALGLFDEYANGLRSEAVWLRYRLDHPIENPLPWAFGLMDGFFQTELSSSNDYPESYANAPFAWDASTVTSQAWERNLAFGGEAESCWDTLVTLFDSALQAQSTSLHFTVPPEGIFVDGQSSSEDRSGPDANNLSVPYFFDTVVTSTTSDTPKAVVQNWKLETLLGRVLKQENGQGVSMQVDLTGQAPQLDLEIQLHFAIAPTLAPTYTLTTESGDVFSSTLQGADSDYTVSVSIGSALGGIFELDVDGQTYVAQFETDPYLADGGVVCGDSATGFDTPPPTNAARVVWRTIAPVASLPDSGLVQAGSAVAIAFNESLNGRDSGVISLRYSDKDVAGIDESSLKLYRWDDDDTWVEVPGQWISAVDNIAAAASMGEGLYAIFGTPTSDITIPEAITDLSAVTGESNWTIKLAWTAPSDDGAAVTAYDLRFSESEITDENVDDTLEYPLSIEPASPGSQESTTVSMANPDALYYFVIRAVDEAGNIATMSNVASARSYALDSDGDGISDSYEKSRGLDVVYADAHLDLDGDGLSNLTEYHADTHPLEKDSDTDGLPDGWENDNQLDPLQAGGDDGADGDPDNDGFTNLEEYKGDSDPQEASSVPASIKATGCAVTSTSSPSSSSGDLVLLAFVLAMLLQRAWKSCWVRVKE